MNTITEQTEFFVRFLALFGYINLNIFVYGTVLNFWTWVRIPPSPPFYGILRTL